MRCATPVVGDYGKKELRSAGHEAGEPGEGRGRLPRTTAYQEAPYFGTIETMIGPAELTDEVVREAVKGVTPRRDTVLEAVVPQVRLMVAARLSPTPNRLHIIDDLTQECLLALTDGLQRLQVPTVDGLNAYLSGIVTHKLAEGARGNGDFDRLSPASLDSTVESLSHVAPLWQFLSASGPSPRTWVERSEQTRQLLSSLGQLKPVYRQVITFALFDQLRTREIAIRMSISRAAVSMLLLRAVRTLRSKLVISSTAGRSDGG